MLYVVYVNDHFAHFATTYAKTCPVSDHYIDMGYRVRVCEVDESGNERIMFDSRNGN